MHPEQQAYCLSVRVKHPELFVGQKVIDVGSRDINGNNRYLFTDCEYIGLDVAAGKNVDVVEHAHVWLKGRHGEFGVSISTEALEHDPFWIQTLRSMVGCLRPGGLMLLTCATTGRPEHGTEKSKPWDNPDSPWPTYYGNRTEGDVRRVLDCDALFSEYEFAIGESTHDLYFYGIKRGEEPADKAWFDAF